MKINPKSRRAFLVGSGRTLMALPFLPSVMPRAMAQSGPVIKKRFVMIHNGHCQAVDQWLPDPARFTFTEHTNGREVALSAIPGAMSPVLNTNFDSLRSKLLIISRLDPTSSLPNHNAEVLLTGGVKEETSDSLDQILAAKLYGTTPLNLYVKSVFDQGYTGFSHLSMKGGNYVPGQFNPRAVFQSIFGSGGGPAPTPRRQLLAVDRVLEELRALKSNRNLSSVDKQRLDQHTELVFDIETRLNQAPVIAPGCTSVTGPASSPVYTSNAPDYQVVIDQMFDVLELALKCGHTNVATVMMHVYDYFAGSIGFIPGIPGTVRMHEDVGHAETPEHREMKLAFSRFLGQRVSRFLNNMNVVEDTNTGLTYLDNSLIVWGNDQGALANTVAHASVNMPILVAGSAGGALKTGKYVDYGPAYGPSHRRPVGGDEGAIYRRGRPYNQFLVTIARVMGLQPSDYEKDGIQGFGVYGPRTFSHEYLGGNHRRDLLPLIT